ncbi:hypothetical protein D8X55_02930 [Malacoplasma penetrans]|uniref:P35 lipoprotein homolog n=1 Tax=Malacoplasma penetrans (strain HF-2) TaxID=272633 RepID=Q8EWE2_MALP2|nr:P35 family lipoprotein [Malacoplasma penetrans]RXY96699.1 hypothetical protein D8X55_02930 [Malacoplasma penetrans]BAC44054.1 P35 lipoprotein homolog [Malacoplasma penetrans HF-2]
MKTAKKKVLKTLAITGAFGIIATVPVIISACSSASNNSNTNGGNNTGDNSGNGTRDPQKVTPKLKSSINLVGSITDIYNHEVNNTSHDLLIKKIKSNLGLVFENESELVNKDINIKLESDFSNSEWIGETYNVTNKNWGSDTTTKLTYAHSLAQINFSSLNDLKMQLSDQIKIKEILKESGVPDTYLNTYKIENKTGLTENNILHINVIEVGKSSPKNYDLQIPVSDLKLVLPQVNVLVSENDINSINQPIDINFNIGIESHSNYVGPVETQIIDERASANSILEKLGFIKMTNTKNSNKTNMTFTEINGASVTTNIDLDSDKVGETLGVFNTTFSDVKLTRISEWNPYDVVSTEDNYLTYKIDLNGRPNKGYYFEDGTTESKEFSFNVKTTERTAFLTAFVSTNLANKTFKWKNAGLTNPINNHDELEKKLEAHANGNTDSNIHDLLNSVAFYLILRTDLYNSHIKLLKDETDGYIKVTNNKLEIRITAIPNKGYLARTTMTSDFNRFKTWVTVDLS